MARLQNNQYLTKYPYWLPLPIGLTGLAGERKQVLSNEAPRDLLIVGGSTDLMTSKVRFGDYRIASLGDSGGLRMREEVPILSVGGKRDSAVPVRRWPSAYRLQKQNRIRGDVLNVGPESRGHFVLACEPLEVEEYPIRPERSAGQNMFYFTLQSNFTSTALEQTAARSERYEWDLLIIGAYTDSTAASTGVRITDHLDRQWCPPADFIPLWALCGRAASQLPLLRWHEPYFMPRGSVIYANFRNAVTADAPEASRSITFECLQLAPAE